MARPPAPDRRGSTPPITGLEHDEEKAGASPESLDERALVDFRTGDASVMFGPTGREALFGPGTELRKVDGVVYMRFQTPELPVPMPNPSPVRRTGPEGPSPAASSQTWMKIDITDNGDPIEHPAMGILSGALGSVGLVPEPTTWLAASIGKGTSRTSVTTSSVTSPRPGTGRRSAWPR